MTTKPQLLAWLTCDAVHMDPATGKHTILGVFSNIQAHRFPITHPSMIWFLTLTDCKTGHHRLRISLGLEPTQMQKIIERDFEAPGPLNRINIINEIRGFTFPQAGEYSILIEVDDEPLLATSMTLVSPGGNQPAN